MKGFSLFTPLVGTALLLISIVIAASIIGEMTSRHRALVSQVDISRNANIIKLAKASLDEIIIKNAKEVAKNEVCKGHQNGYSASQISKNIKQRLEGTEIFSGLIKSFNEIPEVKSVWTNCSCWTNMQTFDTCASFLTSNAMDFVSVQVSQNGDIYNVDISIDGDQLSEISKECPFLIYFETFYGTISFVFSPSSLSISQTVDTSKC